MEWLPEQAATYVGYAANISNRNIANKNIPSSFFFTEA